MENRNVHYHDCNQREAHIYTVPIFKSLTIEEKDYIHSLMSYKHFSQGEMIYSPGEMTDSLLILNSGKIKIYRLSETGKEQLIRIVMPGQFTGELAFFKGGRYEAFAEAIEDIHCCLISYHDFRDLLSQYPSVAIEMLSVLANRLGTSEQQTAWATTETVHERLIHFLYSLAKKTDKPSIVDLGMSKKDLASYLGTTSETLSRELNRLEREGIIQEIAYRKFKLL